MWWHKLCRPFFSFIFHLIPSGLRCPVFAARGVARLQKADRIPLALSRFLRRGAVPACKNRSAAPNTAPCFVHRTRSLCLPLLRFGCFCRRQRSAAQPSAPSGAPAACGRGPLALSQFSLRAAVRPCENWSAAPASPRCICRRQRSAQLPPVGGLWASDCFLHRSASRRIVCPKLCRSPAGFRFPPSRP